MQVFRIVQTAFFLFFFFLSVSLKEIRYELVDMPLVNGPIFIQNILFFFFYSFVN